MCDVNARAIEVAVYANAGRPKQGELPTRIEYQITGELCTPLVSRQTALHQLGLFIITTNDVSDGLDMASLLSSYKAQQNVEKGFRFLKILDFLTSAIYLKKLERIEALLMVMASCLMMYASLGHQIRKTLKDKACYFPDQKKKPNQTPTARWVFKCFENITVLYQAEHIPLVMNLK